jgi:hypothetical protein
MSWPFDKLSQIFQVRGIKDQTLSDGVLQPGKASAQNKASPRADNDGWEPWTPDMLVDIMHEVSIASPE